MTHPPSRPIARFGALCTLTFACAALYAQDAHEHTGGAGSQPLLDSMPTWHPLIVHLPVMLLPLALLFGGIAFFRKEITWKIVTGLCLLGGAVGALMSAYWLHPHTHNLPSEIMAVLEEHETYADWTVGLSWGAVVAGAAWYFLPDYRRAAGIAMLVLLLGATAAVTLAGHHGAMLVYQGGVGAQGAYLEQH